MGTGSSSPCQSWSKKCWITRNLREHAALDGRPRVDRAEQASESCKPANCRSASLPKSRILEIYLNIIEWGPGIYGIGQAAQHYFGQDVREITPKQAAFLVSIIPNPIKYYVCYRHGALSEIWETRVHELLIKMKEHGLLNEEEFVQAEEAPIVNNWGVLAFGTAIPCLAELSIDVTSCRQAARLTIQFLFLSPDQNGELLLDIEAVAPRGALFRVTGGDGDTFRRSPRELKRTIGFSPRSPSRR
jgi:hypothetical protein